MIRREVHFGRVVPAYADRPGNVHALFSEQVTRAPHAPALVDGDIRLSYGELDARAERLAAGLWARGVRKGERVATLIGNRVEVVEVSLACARIGAIHVPLDIRQRRPEIVYALCQSGAQALIFDCAHAGELPNADETPDLVFQVVLGGDRAGAMAYAELFAAAPRGETPAVGEEDVFCLLYTSGTTGRPKGAMLTHLGVIHSCLNYRHMVGIGAEDRVVLAVPCSHMTGLIGVIQTTLAFGACLILMPQFKARRFLELAERERMTAVVMVPAMYNLCLMDPEFDRFDLSPWRIGAFGGAPMPEPNARRLKAACPQLELFNVYGATETSAPVAILPRGTPIERLDCVGKLVPCVDVRIMDDQGREVPPGGAGEIWICGASVVPGYWRNAEADAGAFTGGYWCSGDIGSIDAEGYLRVFDRKKDMINRAGYKVYSAEVESVLLEFSGISEVAVVGYPDPVLGERVAAFVVADHLDEALLRQHCVARLSDYKVPDRVTLLSEGLPRNPNGKVLKAVLRQQIAASVAT